MSGQTLEESLPALPLHMQTDTALTQHLAARFYARLPTATLNSQALITFNTNTSASDGHNGTEEGSAVSATKDLASRMWARLGHRQENQAVLFLGESGAGKTTLRSHLLSSLLSFSSTPLSNKLSFAAFIFDSLTTTRTATTPSASKAGLFYELQYETTSASHPTLIGGKLLDHRLERSRASRMPTAGERNFHILYYLVQGASAKDQDHLGLLANGNTAHGVGSRASIGKNRFRYLGHPANFKVGTHDEDGFKQFQYALRKLEFPVDEIAQICQILATILHLGQLEFHTTSDTTPAANDSGGYSHEGGESVTRVSNAESLDPIAAFLGVSKQDLETTFSYKTRTLHKERVTVMLDPAGAQNSADELARTLYALLVAWIIESINKRVCAAEEAIHNTVSIVDFPGFAKEASSSSQILDQLLNNAATEQLYNVTLTNFFERQVEMLDTEEVSIPPTSYFDNSDAVRGLLKPGNGLLSILDDQAKRGKTDHQFLDAARRRFADKNPAIAIGSSTAVMPGSNFATHNAAAVFTVRHYAGEVDYPVEGLMDANTEVISGDMLTLIGKTRSHFVRELFGQEVMNKVVHPNERNAVMQASIASKPTRMPSMARKKYDKQARAAARAVPEEDTISDPESRTSTFVGGRGGKATDGAQPGVASQFLSSLQAITKSLTAPHTNNYFVFCMKSNDKRMTHSFDVKSVRQQLQTFGIVEISQRIRNADFSIFMPFGDFLSRAEGDAIFVGSEREKCEDIVTQRRWPANEARCGVTGVFLSERCWFEIADISSVQLPPRTQYVDAETDDEGMTPGSRGFGGSNVHLIPGATPGGYYDDKHGNYFGVKDADLKSDAGASAVNGDMFRNLETRSQMAEKANEKSQGVQNVEEHQVSGSRKRWMFFVYALTFYIPNVFIKWFGKKKRPDMQIAWREKLAINLLIWLSIAGVMFFMVGFPELICPRQDVFTMAELSAHDGKGGNDAYVAIRGVVYDLGALAPRHYPSIVPQSALMKYAGKEATNLFPVQVSALCNGKDGTVDDAVQLDYRNTNYSDTKTLVGANDLNARYHDFRWFTNDSRPDWWWEQQYTMKHNYQKGNVGYPPKFVKKLASQRNSIAIIHDRVYDLTSYIAGGRTPQYGSHDQPDEPPDSNFMDNRVVTLFQTGAGTDVSRFWDNLDVDAGLKNRMQVCLDNLFYVGNVDTRSSTQCLFAAYILLAISILLCSVIGFKFLAALQFGKKNVPENLDKFVICTVPAYTEDEDSLRRAIDSAARMRYDDKRKLLLIICDGMIVGQGNDRPTPRIVLDILGISESVDPEPLSFESLGEGQKQHNMGKVYSGLYEVQGHIVPFLVIVKVGKPSEVQKPGNRGKRDSQMILMRFLNRVHYNLPMTPMELEMHHQIRNIIGVNPTFYEFTLQIDADTVVASDSATRMVASMVADTNIIGVCGETALTNAKTSAITAIQVYEYYISHNLTKAFESLFGSVTCLPGCFTMYRIRAADTGKPLFVSKEVVEDYAEIRVDTLHMKNLLHLGEDRYLTTLLLKYHPKYKTKYIFRAHAWTIAPESWSIFLSQRRRWINSTVHNLIELIPLQQLCGFCCFSMRFIVFIDLLSTIVQPTIVGYITYLIYLLIKDSSIVPITAFILLGAIYGLQAIIFILRRKWEMIGWMIIYILATPVFACALPLYSFWHMDDFSWGNTRIVTGEKGQKVVISDEGKFDPASIPRKRWEDYQAELWEAQTQHDTQSEISGYSYATKSFPHGSVHGGASPWQRVATPGSDYANIPPSRPMSHLDLGRANSRMSLAPSQVIAGQGGGEPYDMELNDINLPSDDVLLAEIRNILANADMMKTSKKTVKDELERRFQCDLSPKRKYIGYCVESIISGQL